MESASDIVDKIRELECDWLYELTYNEAAALIEARDTAIRKECADRGVKWAMMALGPLIMNSETRDELSAAIMGEE